MLAAPGPNETAPQQSAHYFEAVIVNPSSGVGVTPGLLPSAVIDGMSTESVALQHIAPSALSTSACLPLPLRTIKARDLPVTLGLILCPCHLPRTAVIATHISNHE